MTRRRDLMCEDIFECDHEPEVAISEGGEVIAWRCRCGRKTVSVEEVQRQRAAEKGAGRT